MSEPRVIYATTRETIADEIPIECRFDDGQKFAAVTVAAGFDELAESIAAFLSYSESRNRLFRDWLRRILGGFDMPPDMLDRFVSDIADEVPRVMMRRHYGEDRGQ